MSANNNIKFNKHYSYYLNYILPLFLQNNDVDSFLTSFFLTFFNKHKINLALQFINFSVFNWALTHKNLKIFHELFPYCTAEQKISITHNVVNELILTDNFDRSFLSDLFDFILNNLSIDDCSKLLINLSNNHLVSAFYDLDLSTSTNDTLSKQHIRFKQIIDLLDDCLNK